MAKGKMILTSPLTKKLFIATVTSNSKTTFKVKMETGQCYTFLKGRNAEGVYLGYGLASQMTARPLTALCE